MMTAQIQDQFVLDGVDYALAGISTGELFDPALLDLTPVGICSACWRGYLAVFGLVEGRLVLKTLHINLNTDTDPITDVVGTSINGVTPSGQHDRHDWFNNHYHDINYYLEYSGGLLLADEFIEDLYVHMGFHPAWKYKIVRELIFTNGQLDSNTDRSEQLAEIRQSFLAVRDSSESPRTPSREEIRRFVERAFDRKYNL